jgi:hypothetical protein
MKDHSHLITREHIFKAERLKYDVEALRRRRLKYARVQRQRGARAYGIPAELRTVFSENRHAVIDKLSGTKPSARAASDQINPVIFDRLIEKVERASRRIAVIVNKLVAHAATPVSRGRGSGSRLKTTLGELWDAHRAICQVASFLSVQILGDANYGGLPVPQYDQFQYLDRPLVSGREVQHLRQVWIDYERETQNWANWTPADLVKEGRIRTVP